MEGGKKGREVSGLDLRLVEAVERGIVPRPPLMDQGQWLIWRSGEGMRPSIRRTGEVSTTLLEEISLWEATTLRFYGAKWAMKLGGTRMMQEHNELSKGKMTAEQFETVWVNIISELEMVGQGFNQRSLLLGNLRKLDPNAR